MLPLPSFRDLPATLANLTATPGLPAHVVATPAPPPLHLPTLVASPTAPPPVVHPSSCNTSLAEVSSFCLLWDQTKGERGEEGHCVRNNNITKYIKHFKCDGRNCRRLWRACGPSSSRRRTGWPPASPCPGPGSWPYSASSWSCCWIGCCVLSGPDSLPDHTSWTRKLAIASTHDLTIHLTLDHMDAHDKMQVNLLFYF